MEDYDLLNRLASIKHYFLMDKVLSIEYINAELKLTKNQCMIYYYSRVTSYPSC